jgi:dolichol-phosphate mannosyltransferase
VTTEGTPTTLVVLPTFDEATSLPRVLEGLRALPVAVDVLVVDDASPDGTGAVAAAAARGDPRVHVLHRPSRAGLGSAYRDGFAWGLGRGYALLVAMDADRSHDPAALPDLLAAARTTDLVIGSRYVSGGRIERWSLGRRLLSAGGNRYARTVTGLPVRDGTSGYRVVHRAVLDALDVTTTSSEGYAFQLEVVWRAWRAGFSVVEVPITFVERRDGASKLSRAVVAEAVWRPLTWALAGRRRPSRPHPRSVRASPVEDPRTSR